MNRIIIKICAVIVGLVMLVGITARTVSGKEQKPELPTIEAYESMETEYLAEVKTILAENYYSNCGINMTKVIDTDENRAYTIEIYHSRLSNADEETKQALLKQLITLEGFGEYCTIEYRL